MAEIVPFFATEVEQKAVGALPVEGVKPDDVAQAVPKFHDVVCGGLLVQWAMLTLSSTGETVCEYHIYKRDRKEVFDQTEELLRTLATPEARNAAAESANELFIDRPWWPNTEESLFQCLSEHFKGSSGRVGYHQEVDSWSVSVYPENLALMKWGEDHLSAFADRLWAKIKG